MRAVLDDMEHWLVDNDQADTLASGPPLDVNLYASDMAVRGLRLGDAFWNTLTYYFKARVTVIGDHEMPEGMVIQLTDDVGLQVLASAPTIWDSDNPTRIRTLQLNMRFVPMPDTLSMDAPVVTPDGWSPAIHQD